MIDLYLAGTANGFRATVGARPGMQKGMKVPG
jgi:hypothetical protein